jgi:hypothetical protein
MKPGGLEEGLTEPSEGQQSRRENGAECCVGDQGTFPGSILRICLYWKVFSLKSGQENSSLSIRLRNRGQN